MYYGFQTENENAAIGALLVYGCYCSRDTTKFKVTPDMWGIIERAVKSASKRAMELNDFIEKFKSKVSCSSIKPNHMMSHAKSEGILIPDGSGGYMQLNDNGKKEFWINIIESANNELVLQELYKHTSFIIIIVRDRLEREKQLKLLGKLSDEKFEEETENE